MSMSQSGNITSRAYRDLPKQISQQPAGIFPGKPRRLSRNLLGSRKLISRVVNDILQT